MFHVTVDDGPCTLNIRFIPIYSDPKNIFLDCYVFEVLDRQYRRLGGYLQLLQTGRNSHNDRFPGYGPGK